VALLHRSDATSATNKPHRACSKRIVMQRDVANTYFAASAQWFKRFRLPPIGGFASRDVNYLLNTHKYTYNVPMRYSYDRLKKAANLKKHGLDFDDARQVIESGQTVTFEDNRFEYDEPRFITMGMLSGAVVVIVTTESDTEIRIISMRKAEKDEQKIYFGNL
jgi:uncharacterized protein